MSLGISRVVARLLTERTVEKEMDATRALAWLRSQDLDAILGSGLLRADAERALAAASSAPGT